MSRQIKLLESELKTGLVERHSRGIRATIAGEYLVEYCRDQRAHRDDLIARLEELRGLRTGHVAVLIGEGFAADFIDGPIRKFFQEYPGITVNIQVANTAEVVRRIVECEAEIGVVYNLPRDPKLVSRAAGKHPMKAIVNPSFPILGKQKSISAKTLSSYPIAISQVAHGTRKMLDAVGLSAGITIKPVLTTNSIAVLKRFAMSGQGITVLPEFAVQAELVAGELCSIDISHPLFQNAEAHIITCVGRRLSLAATTLMTFAGSQMRAFR